MNCKYCNDTGKYKKPNDEKEFDEIIDREMDKGYFVNIEDAKEIAYKKVGYTMVDCPFCAVKTSKN